MGEVSRLPIASPGHRLMETQICLSFFLIFHYEMSLQFFHYSWGAGGTCLPSSWPENCKSLLKWAMLSGHWNYMGVVSRLLIASPGHKLMEIHYVY